ncbi:MAG TPA: FecR family protein [Methylomirabilota bacterium]|nr:FecR family protein [Methylomirabilota bacterium]
MRLLKAVLIVVMLGVVVSPTADRASGQGAEVGAARNAIGTLLVVHPDGIQDRLRGKGLVKLFEEDVLKTEPGSQALIDFTDGVVLALNQNTTIKLLSRWEKTKGITRIVRLQEGEVWVKTGEGPKALEVETPVATAIVKETEFNMRVHPDGQSVLTVIQGTVEFGTAFGTCPIRTNTVSYGVRGKRCTRPEPTDVKSVLGWSRPLVQ